MEKGLRRATALDRHERKYVELIDPDRLVQGIEEGPVRTKHLATAGWRCAGVGPGRASGVSFAASDEAVSRVKGGLQAFHGT